jgi:hypothetical protein
MRVYAAASTSGPDEFENAIEMRLEDHRKPGIRLCTILNWNPILPPKI